jgi:hypothetical protein
MAKEISSLIDVMLIEKAREDFKKKDFKKSLEIYGSVENKDLLEELDKKIIEFCELHFKDQSTYNYDGDF